MIVTPLIEKLNITENVLSVIDDLNVMHGINMTNLEKHIDSYLNISQIESLDLKDAAHQLDHFRTITKLKSYIPGKISIDDRDTIGTTTSVLCWLFVILILFAIIGCCIRCFKPCADCFAAIVQCVKCCLPEKLCIQTRKMKVWSPPTVAGVSFSTTSNTEPDISLNIVESTPIQNVVEPTRKFGKLHFPRQNRHYASSASVNTELTSISQSQNKNLALQLQWFIDDTASQIFLKSLAEGKVVIYNWLTDRMETLDNEPLQCEYYPPHYGIVIAAIKSTDELDFPQLQLDDNNLQCLVSDPDIYFHSSLNKYIRKSNNAIVCGIKPIPRGVEGILERNTPTEE